MIHNPDGDLPREHLIPVDLTQPLVLEIHSPAGDVAVRAVERPDVRIDADVLHLSDDSDDEASISVDARGNRIEIRSRPHAGVGWASFAGGIDLESVVGQVAKAFRAGAPFASARPGTARVRSGGHGGTDMAIEIPRTMSCQLEVHSASGDMHIDGVSGEISLSTMSGDVHVARTAGRLALHVASGDLVIEDASARLTARTASGDVRVASAQIEGCEIQTANGDVLLEALLGGDGPFQIRTASGDVRLRLRRQTAAGEEPAANLAFRTVSGDAQVGPPFRKIDRRRWQSGSGGAGPLVDVTTVNGDLIATIAAAEGQIVPAPRSATVADAAPPPPAPPAPADWEPGEDELAGAGARAAGIPSTTTDEAARLTVLEAVERGDMDIEEALRRLDAEEAGAGS